MQVGEQLKYGWNRGGKLSTVVEMAASQDLVHGGGRLIFMTAGAAALCTDGTATIFGEVEYGEGTPSTGEELNCIIDLTAVFRLPISGGSYAIAMIGDECDLEMDVTATGIQSVQLDDSVENLVVVVGGDADNNNWVDIMMNPDVWGTGIGVEA